MNRAAMLDAFLNDAGWGGATRHPLAGDASSRKYIRLEQNGRTAMLMDAPPETCGSQEAFLRIAAHLDGLSLRAPKVLAAELDLGALLLQDFGDAVMAGRTETSIDAEASLYTEAVDVLVTLHDAPPPPWVETARAETLAQMIAPAFDFYAPSLGPSVKEPATRALQDALNALPEWRPTLALRDYHAENLIWLPDEKRLGLLDFQDAIATHPAYDLVSLLQDARRDLSPGIEEQMIERFLSKTGSDPAAFLPGYHLIGLQRNLRILGIFCRLAETRGKPHYLTLLPRVWGYVARTLARPEMADLREAFSTLPKPEDRA